LTSALPSIVNAIQPLLYDLSRFAMLRTFKRARSEEYPEGPNSRVTEGGEDDVEMTAPAPAMDEENHNLVETFKRLKLRLDELDNDRGDMETEIQKKSR
jgi:hypothetical protein